MSLALLVALTLGSAAAAAIALVFTLAHR
jgi:hypothetical protein